MRRALSGSLLSVCLLSAGASEGAPAAPFPEALRATAATLRDEALQGTRAYEIVRSLTVEVGPRPAGSAADRRAVEWGVRTMRELGFANVRAEAVKVPHWDPGVSTGEIVSPWPQPVVLLPLGGSVGTPDGGIEADVVAVPSIQDLEKTDPEKVKGRIVFINKRMERKRDGSDYGPTVAGRGRGAIAAGKLGAVALLLRSVGTDNNRTPHTGAMRGYEEGGPRIPAVALSNPDADLLEAQLASGKPVRFHLAVGSRSLPEAESANVIGEIPGREKPDEVVVLGCHLDSWFPGTGAIDDGAGCAIMMEAARRIGALPTKPRRTIRVVLFANEEFGLSGARAYAEKYAADLPKHILAGESDFGSGRIWQISSRVAPEALPFVDELQKLLAPLNVERGDNEADGGADLSPMAPARVPLIGLSQDGTYYFDWHHTANDTLDKIDPKDMDQNVAAWAAVAWAAAEMPGDFGRAPAGE